MWCVFNDQAVCVACKRKTANPESRRMCRAGPAAAEAEPRQVAEEPGLGDVVALWLERFGITPARIERLTGRPCGCEKRKRWLNQLWRWTDSSSSAGRGARGISRGSR